MESTKRIGVGKRLELPVEVSVGDLTLIASGVANYSVKERCCIHVGALTVEFIFQNNESGKAVFERKADPALLLYQYVIGGKLPESPLSLGLPFPENIGIALGYPIWLTFCISALGSDCKGVTLQYSVYQGTLNAGSSIGRKVEKHA